MYLHVVSCMWAITVKMALFKKEAFQLEIRFIISKITNNDRINIYKNYESLPRERSLRI